MFFGGIFSTSNINYGHVTLIQENPFFVVVVSLENNSRIKIPSLLSLQSSWYLRQHLVIFIPSLIVHLSLKSLAKWYCQCPLWLGGIEMTWIIWQNPRCLILASFTVSKYVQIRRDHKNSPRVMVNFLSILRQDLSMTLTSAKFHLRTRKMYCKNNVIFTIILIFSMTSLNFEIFKM